jgi:hypothetical protein
MMVVVVEVARAQTGGDTATHEVGHWLAKCSVRPQVVVGMINDETVLFWIHVEVRVFANGRARGTMQFREVGGDRDFLFRVVGGELIDEGESEMELALSLVQIGEHGEPLGLLSRADVSPGTRTIYTTHDGDILCFFVFIDD